MTTRYVLGLLFSRDFDTVTLIKKNRPEWQAGTWNGVGGHVEPGENPNDAMVREFREETGVLIDNWSLFALKTGKGFQVVCYASINDRRERVNTMTDEEVAEWSLGLIPGAVGHRFDPDLELLIAAARNHFNQDRKYFVTIQIPK